jgi:hypothetical protein
VAAARVRVADLSSVLAGQLVKFSAAVIEPRLVIALITEKNAAATLSAGRSSIGKVGHAAATNRVAFGGVPSLVRKSLNIDACPYLQKVSDRCHVWRPTTGSGLTLSVFDEDPIEVLLAVVDHFAKHNRKDSAILGSEVIDLIDHDFCERIARHNVVPWSVRPSSANRCANGVYAVRPLRAGVSGSQPL